jgi:hypothetical protein
VGCTLAPAPLREPHRLKRKISRVDTLPVLAIALVGGFSMAFAARADEVTRAQGGRAGTWERLGQVTATHHSDHDRITVEGRGDSFRKLKFHVSDSPLAMHRVVVTYDSGAPESLDIREDLPKGADTRAIDLHGGKRHIHTIEFWYETQGMLNGKADVTAYGQH